jgi:hypothetical protein
MIPKIQFVYSPIYDKRCKFAFEKRSPNEKYPDRTEIIAYIKKVERVWSKIDSLVLSVISKISGLKWRENIKCYVVGRIRPFSDPMSIRIYDDTNLFIDTLIHELIHQILTQNGDILEKYWVNIKKKYSLESEVTQNHIIVHAIHKEVYTRLFSDKRLKSDITRSENDNDYKRSWGIVLNDFENIIKELKTYSKKVKNEN